MSMHVWSILIAEKGELLAALLTYPRAPSYLNNGLLGYMLYGYSNPRFR